MHNSLCSRSVRHCLRKLPRTASTATKRRIATVTETLQTHEPPPPNRFDAIRSAKPLSDFLTDTHQRHHDYLRISITERCNLRCLYCMPEEGIQLSPKQSLMTPHEILYLSQLFVSQGVQKIRLTGGEPTIHPEFLNIIKEIGNLKSAGLQQLAITTNGLTLAKKLDRMVDAGLTGINLSLDTLDPFQFELMTRRKGFDKVMQSITRILEMKRCGANLKLKLNVVVIRGLNDSQIMPFVEMTRDKDLEVRFIEYMPFDGNRWSNKKMLGYRDMLDTIRSVYPTVQRLQDHVNETSKTFQIPGFHGKIGFITSMTDHFCGTCNRLRITSDGNLKVCLFGNSEVSLRDMIRNGFNGGKPLGEPEWRALRQAGPSPAEGELLDLIGMAVKRKKAKHAGLGVLEHLKNRPMILIGG